MFHALSKLGQVGAYRHEGYWTTLETKRELADAEKLWEQGGAVWIGRPNGEG